MTTGESRPSAGEIRTTAQRWMEEIWRPGDLTTFDELHAPGFTDHSPAGRGGDRAAYRAGIEALFAAFPDFTAVTEDLLVDAEAGKACVRWSATGTQGGPFLGQPASGQVVRFSGIEIIAIRDGQITARWGEWDGLAILEQIQAREGYDG